MELIAGLESTPRGLYCGAIGWIDAPRDGPALRRLLPVGGDPHAHAGRRREAACGRCGWASAPASCSTAVADDEFDECRLKARFLTGLDPGFELFETRAVRRPRANCRTCSATSIGWRAAPRALGFAFDADAARALLDAAAAERSGTPRRLRLALGARWPPRR